MTSSPHLPRMEIVSLSWPVIQISSCRHIVKADGEKKKILFGSVSKWVGIQLGIPVPRLC